jgi:putative ABC transport system permease protein
MQNLWQDLRYGARMLLKNPGFTLIAVITLALGIGANTAIFSVVYSVLLRPLAVEEPAALVAITNDTVSYPAYTDFRDQNHVFSGVMAFSGRAMSLSQGGQPELISGGVVTGNYFDVLGVKAIVGRTFLPEEDRTPGTHPVTVLSHRLWQQRFNSDRSVVGKSLRLNGENFTIIGVAPPGFRGTRLDSLPDLWAPIAMWPRLATGSLAKLDIGMRGWGWLSVVGRMRPGVSIERAETELNFLAKQQEQTYPRGTPKGFHVELHSLTTAFTGMRGRQDVVRFLWLLMTAVGAALAIACANVANLLLARAGVRRKEIAVRLALGADRRRLVRQLLTESVLLSLIGGVTGLLIAVWAIDMLGAFKLAEGVALEKLGLGLKREVLGFTFFLSLVTGLAFGLAPALQASKTDLVSTLKDQVSTTTPSRSHLRNSLVAVQVALCLLLLISTGLFVRSLRRALNLNLGFNPERVATVSVNLGLQRYDETRADAFFGQLSERIAASPGVQSASWAAVVPLGEERWTESFQIEGYQPQPGERMSVDTNFVTPDYFRTLEIPLLQGHDFIARDRAGAPNVAIINQAMARKYWPGQDPIGKRFIKGKTDITIIGVAQDAKFQNLREQPQPQVFLPLAQRMSDAGLGRVTFLVRTAGDPTSIFPSVAREVRQLDDTLPLFNVKPLGENISDLLTAQRLGSALLGLFSMLALTLSVIGIYGVVAYSVSQRTREIGIRLALGAQRRDILRLVLGQGSIPILLGIILGTAAAAVVTRMMAGFLYGVAATDPAAFAGSTLLLSAAALLASYVPARRATKVDPMAALRTE